MNNMKRVARVVKLNPVKLDEYKQLHRTFYIRYI
jgi:L-rhamnose mutarotase